MSATKTKTTTSNSNNTQTETNNGGNVAAAGSGAAPANTSASTANSEPTGPLVPQKTRYANVNFANSIMYFTKIVSGPSGLGGEFQGPVGQWANMSNAEKYRALGCTGNEPDGNVVRALGVIVNVPLNSSRGTQQVPMNKAVAADIQAICNEILQLGWFNLISFAGWRGRNSVGGGRVSRHCYGAAIDINYGGNGNPWFAGRNCTHDPEPPAGAPAHQPQKTSFYNGTYDHTRCIWHGGHPVVGIFARHGWGWGGRYGDVMHFSIFNGG